jgi:sulfite exporter TauE/SafE
VDPSLFDPGIGGALLAAFLMGLLGSGHCAGMCGGIACTLTLSLDPAVRTRPTVLARYLLAFSAGRVASYCVAGAIVGLVGARAAGVLPVAAAHVVGFVVSGLLLVAVGAHVAGWWRGMALLERLGARAWRRIEPLGRRLAPVHSPLQALALGGVWGWLPCGLVYGALVLALTAGGGVDGAMRMLAFGLGTVPMVVGIGAAGGWIGALARDPMLRRWAGGCLVALGLLTVLGAGLLHPEHDSGLADARDRCVAAAAGPSRGPRAGASSPATRRCAPGSVLRGLAADVLEQRPELLADDGSEDRVLSRLERAGEVGPVGIVETALGLGEDLVVLAPHVVAHERHVVAPVVLELGPLDHGAVDDQPEHVEELRALVHQSLVLSTQRLDRRPCSWILGAQPVEHQVFHRVMETIGVLRHVEHDVVHQLEVRVGHLVDGIELRVEQPHHPRDVAVVDLELRHDIGHGGVSVVLARRRADAVIHMVSVASDGSA